MSPDINHYDDDLSIDVIQRRKGYTIRINYYNDPSSNESYSTSRNLTDYYIKFEGCGPLYYNRGLTKEVDFGKRVPLTELLGEKTVLQGDSKEFRIYLDKGDKLNSNVDIILLNEMKENAFITADEQELVI